MKLFDAAWAPSPRRVRIYLQEKGLEIDRVIIDLRRGEHLLPDYLKINPRGQLPALLLDDGTLIDDSIAICRYFEWQHPDPPLFGRDAREAGLVEAWLRRIEEDCYAAAVSAFRNGGKAFADRALPGEWPPISQIPALAERGRLMWGAFADILERHLRRHSYVAGDGFSFADIAAIVAIDFGISIKLADPRDRPAIALWYAGLSARPSMSA
jgi:glutathione S-transferase